MSQGVSLVLKYFANLSDEQYNQFSSLFEVYSDWNSKINVISRKDFGHFYERHVLHSLSIAKYIAFVPGTQILDLGTGGGFPGIPLAILFPDVLFHMIDGTGKKIKVVNDVIGHLGLNNAKGQQIRAEELKLNYDFVLSRAVASIDKLYFWSQRLLSDTHFNPLPNGLIALKGGHLNDELKALPKGSYFEKIPLTDYYDEQWFEEKYLLYVQGE